MVLVQDANQRIANKWLFTKYDQLNRPVVTGFYTDPTHTTQSNMQNYLTTQNMGRYETYNPGIVERYSLNNSFPLATLSNLLTVTFYDDYDWTGWHGSSWGDIDNRFDSYLLNPSTTAYPYAEPVTRSVNTRGLKTGIWQTNVTNGPVTTYIYDQKGRVVQTKSFNITGARDITTTQYNFNGQPLIVVYYQDKQGTNPQTHTLVTRMEYDELGRLLTTQKTVNTTINNQSRSKPEQVIAANEYDALGQLKKKALAPAGGVGRTPLETLEYDYNIRGWSLGMNRSYLETPSQLNHWFAYELAYDKTSNSKGYYTWFWNTQFSGNITGTLWKSRGDGMPRKYDFTYDAANRLTGADFNQQNGQGWDKSDGLDFTVSNLSYDANGNILRMDQKGWKPGGSNTIDNLFYAYHKQGYSNRLKNVWDKTNDTETKLGDFRSSSTYMTALGGTKNENATDYQYDLNGNLKKDLNKDIYDPSLEAIEYNHLNLPVKIRVKNKE
ncbi:hypothetical protein [Paraflavitalea speifideaquila]|uniref:hypothetical protein n=1 Tax=Paraflavitalea speifideaquila TaxID=3076558 RepID=UPI0028E6CF8A|nr:hypothetical protein [Paraflavitalea speifideiaquila]